LAVSSKTDGQLGRPDKTTMMGFRSNTSMTNHLLFFLKASDATDGRITSPLSAHDGFNALALMGEWPE
jgi:hypothetical protein